MMQVEQVIGQTEEKKDTISDKVTIYRKTLHREEHTPQQARCAFSNTHTSVFLEIE